MGRGRVRSGLAQTWGRKLTPREDFTWKTVLERFATDGRPPSVQEMAEKMGVPDDEARTLLADRPAEALVWYDFANAQVTAASCCPATAFFCSNEHLEQWLLAQSRKRVGSRLTLNEGLELARALFEPVLATTSLR